MSGKGVVSVVVKERGRSSSSRRTGRSATPASRRSSSKPKARKGGMRRNKRPATNPRPKRRFSVGSSASRRRSSSNRSIGVRGAHKQAGSAYRRVLNKESSPEQVMMSFIAPTHGQCFRWPYNGGTPETEMTGCATVHNIMTVNYATAFQGTYTGSPSSWVGYLFRQPLRNLVTLINLASSVTYSATFYISGGSPSNSSTYKPPASETYVWFPSVYYSTTNALAPHGPAVTGTGATPISYLYMGSIVSVPDANFIWVGLNDVVNFVATGTGTTDTIVPLFLSNPGSRQPETTELAAISVTTAGTYTFTCAATGGNTTVPGYYAFAINSGATPYTYASNLIVAAGDVLGHQSAPFAIQHPNWLQSVRVNATSLLISNVASELYKEGPLYAALVTDETNFTNFKTAQLITSRARFYDGRNGMGVYGWLPPIGASALERRPALQAQGNIIVSSNFYLDDGCAYEVFRMDNNPNSSGTAPGLDFLLTLETSVEYATTDQWAELEFSVVDAVTALRVLQTAARCDVFAENPLHLRDIVSFVGRASSWIRGHSNRIGGVLAAAFPAYSAPISAIASQLQS